MARLRHAGRTPTTRSCGAVSTAPRASTRNWCVCSTARRFIFLTRFPGILTTRLPSAAPRWRRSSVPRVAESDKGYQGCDGVATPRKKPRGGELSKRDKECNAEISALRAPIERVIAHFKSWRIFHTDYRRPYSTYRDAYDAARGLFFFSLIWGFE